jgi:hypothetical protein
MVYEFVLRMDYEEEEEDQKEDEKNLGREFGSSTIPLSFCTMNKLKVHRFLHLLSLLVLIRELRV